MRRLSRVTGLLLVLVLALPCFADQASASYNNARKAEAREDYESAYVLYKRAFDQHPEDAKYRASMIRSRAAAALQLVHRGQTVRDEGKLEESLALFQRAALIDPSLDIARQEIRRTQDMIQSQLPGAPPRPAPPQLNKLILNAPGPLELVPVSTEPITFSETADVKDIYTSICSLEGINVVFDPDYTSRRIHIALNGVSLIEALNLIGLNSKTFWKPVTPNTVYVASDTTAKRKEVQQNVVRTFYLANVTPALNQTELNDIANVFRNLLNGTQETQIKTQVIQSQSAIVVRGTPDQVALAEKILNDLDKARPEVIVNLIVMQVSRDRLRDLGILPPNQASISLNNNVSSSSSSSTTGTTGTSSSSTINLNRIGNLTAKDFNVTIVGDASSGAAATLNFLMSDNQTKIIQQPQIRAVNGEKASMKIGQRVPTATGSFGAGIGGVGLNSLVNTQFQYIDVGVNVEVTPWVHSEGREVTLKVTMDISSVTGNQNIGGISQPIIGQRKVEHVIRLREGEVNLLGGLLETDTIKNMTGYPWLSQIPLFKYLFSTNHTDTNQNEIVFALIPRIVRAQMLSTQNTRTIDVGTESSTDLRRSLATPPQAIPAAQPAPGGGPQPSTPTTPVPQASQSTPAVMNLDPSQVMQSVGATFAVNVMLSGQNIFSVPAQITYDPNSLQLVNVSNGDFLSQGGQVVTLVHRDQLDAGNKPAGVLQVTASRPPNTGGASGQGAVFTLTFAAKAAGQSSIVVSSSSVRDANMQPVPATGNQVAVTIK